MWISEGFGIMSGKGDLSAELGMISKNANSKKATKQKLKKQLSKKGDLSAALGMIHQLIS